MDYSIFNNIKRILYIQKNYFKNSSEFSKKFWENYVGIFSENCKTNSIFFKLALF